MAWDAEEQEKARAILLDGKSPAEVQKDMAEAWKKFGVKLKFAPPSPREGRRRTPRPVEAEREENTCAKRTGRRSA